MIIAFTLSMPRNNAWNNCWTGAEKMYIVTRTVPKDKASEILKIGSFGCSFGDGWVANISAESVDSRQAAKLRKKSSGFCGYEWMVNSIITTNEIQCPGGDK